MSTPADVPHITTTVTTPFVTADTPDGPYLYTTTAADGNDDGGNNGEKKGQHYHQLAQYASQDLLQPNQRRAIDSQDQSHDDLTSSSLHLAFSDPMLAITQLPNAGRRSSIASSLHSNITSASSGRRHSLFQAQFGFDEKKEPLRDLRKSQEGDLNADGKDSVLTDRNLEAFILPDLTEVDDGSPPMDTSWYGYVIVVSSFIIYFIVFGTEHTFGVYQEFYSSPSAEPFLKNTAPQDIAMIGTLATTFTYLLGAFAGRFADRAGYRVSTVLGAAIMGAGLIGASFAKSLPALYVCQGVVLGVGSSLVYLPAVSCPALWFDRYRSVAIGIVVCGSGFGGLVLGPLTEFLITKVGIHWTLRIQGLICLIGIGGSGMMLKTRVKKVPGQTKRVPMDFTICKEIPFITLTIANFLTSLGYMIPFFFLSVYAVDHGQTASTGAIMIGILNGASLVGRLSLGFITDRVGRINMLFICALVSGLSILCIWSVASSLKVLAVFAIIYGFTCGGYFSVIPAVIADIYGLDRLTTVTGLLYGSIGFGYLIGSPVSGVLLDITKPNTNYIYVVIFSGTTMTLSSFAVFYLKYWRSNGRWWTHG
ncbi:hypothetical protein BGZ99_005770 [Dissophora globulifera]|uniref:Major facilitator superfamily (MFS) profile domain-containing protein n=1 Tax=Dissophora globulifera TaxID=979702 RepID=A0A9P6RU69_9FUNG|nr:hypothetical protein BGZ99_005770 [Dissophora globulifera]